MSVSESQSEEATIQLDLLDGRTFAVKIQSAIRGKIARKEHAEKEGAVITIQALHRGGSTRMSPPLMKVQALKGNQTEYPGMKREKKEITQEERIKAEYPIVKRFIQ
jgi:hypothetical protein